MTRRSTKTQCCYGPSIYLWLALCCLAGFSCPGCRSKTEPATDAKPVTLTVFAPWSMEKRMRRIFEKYQLQQPNVTFKLETGTPGNLVKRMKAGERPDVYVSAGPVGVEVLRKMGIVREGSEKEILRQRLILVCSDTMQETVKDIRDLARPEVRAVGLGRPTLSAGTFSRKALQEAGVLEAVEAKARLSPLRSYMVGIVDAAIILEECCYDEDLLLGQVVPRRDICVVHPVPEEICPAFPVIAVAVTGSAPADAATGFVNFLTGEAPQDTLHRRGPGACPLCDAE